MTPRQRNPRRPPTEIPASRRRPRWAAVSVIAALLAATALAAWWRARPTPIRREAGLNVLLITIDTLRADALGVYGQPRNTSPWIDLMARRGVRFEVARAHNTMTLPSHANILSGRYPFEHGVRDNSGFRFPVAIETLATLLKARGYRTGAFVSALPVDSRFGLDRGFDVYDDAFAKGRTSGRLRIPARVARETVPRARAWIDQPSTEPWFCWIHLFDPHAPYEPPQPWASAFRDAPYLGEVAATDAALQPLLEPLLTAGNSGRTLFILTADHGESLGEHNERTHGVFGYEATLRVPLVLFAPRLFRPRVVSQPVGHVDLMPTVLDALGMEPILGLPGRSLLPLATGHSEAPPTFYFEALTGMLGRGWAPLRGVVSDGFKYVDLPLPEVYDLVRDPREMHNRLASEPLRLSDLRDRLARFPAAERGLDRRDEDAETREQMAALGYLATTAAPIRPRYGEDDDPKRLIHLDDLMQQALSLQRAGRLDAAVGLVKDIVREHPDMTMAWVVLGLLERDAGQLDAAIDALERAVALNREDVASVALLASALSESGHAAETIALLAPFVERRPPPVELLTAQGEALARLGRRSQSLATFERARSIEPASAVILLQIATVHLQNRDFPRARQSLTRALQQDPDLSLAHHQLGLIALAEGDTREAERCFRAALAGDADEADALLNLGRLLAHQGREAEARPLLERFLTVAPVGIYRGDLEQIRSWLERTRG